MDSRLKRVRDVAISRRAFVLGSSVALGSIARRPAEGAEGAEATADGAGVSLRADGRALTRAARPYLAWRYAGELDWRSTLAAAVRVERRPEAFAITADFPECRAEVTCRSLGARAWTLASALTHTGTRPIDLARFHLLDGPLEDPTLGLLMLQGLTPQRLVRPGERIRPFAEALPALWASMQVQWVTASDPVYGASDWALSRDVGCFSRDWISDAWGAAFVGPGLAFGEIGLRTVGERRFFVGQVLDNVLLEPGESRRMDDAMLWYGDWQDGLKRWIAACARAFGVKRPTPAPVGYCSWYQRGQQVERADIERANREFSRWPAPPGGRLIQVDDGYQIKPGDWRPNAKFAGRWPSLAAEIAATGAVPGTYLAPTTIHESHPLAARQPEMLQRLPDGTRPISFSNWTGHTYYVEPDHPAARAFMRQLFLDARSDGWKYVKIDFTYPISTARVAYDRKLTTFQTLRRLYALCREASGPGMRLNACIGEPGRYVLGLVDAARIGGDISAGWKTVKDNLVNVLLFAPTNGVWWQADPDVFYLRQEGSELSPEESFVLTGTLGLLGGLFLTSDFPSQWTPQAQALAREFWNETGPVAPSDQRLIVSADGVMRAYRVSYGARRHRIALYNWSDSAESLHVALGDAGLPDGERWRLQPRAFGEGVTLAKGVVSSPSQPPHSLRIAELIA